MKVIVYIALFLFTSNSMLFGQDLVPFNKNNLYGVIDSLQKVVVEPLFDEILIHNEYGIIAGKLDGIWFFYNLLGKKLVKSNFRSYKINSMHGVYVGNEFVPTSHLLEIREKYGGPRYVLNPFTPEVEPKLLQVDVTCKFEKTWFHELSAAEIGILKITLENGRINFMDTTGNLLSPVWFSSGYLVGRDFMAIDTGGGLLALYSLDFEKRSDFLYDRILGSYNLDYFLADNLSSNGVRTYCLLDTLGRIVFESPQPIKIVDEHFVIVNNEKSGLYSYEGKPVFEYENSFLDYLVADLTKFKIVRSNKTGIVDNKGNIILEPVYKDIFTTSGKYFIATKQNSAGLLDEKFKEIFFMDSIQISLADDFPGFFPAWKSVLNKGRKGLLDSLGRIVIPFEYENIYFENKFKIIIVQKDSTSAAYDIDLNQVWPLRIGNFIFNPKVPEYYFYSNDSVWVFNTNNHLFMRFANDKLQINGSNYYQYLPGFIGKKGEIIFQTRYRQLFSNGTPGPSKYITIGRPNNSTKYFNDVFDSDRNWILPDDYGLLERNTNMHTGSNGMIIVHHIQDVLQKKEIPRAGVIDLKGQWVLLPKSQNIRMNENKQIEVMEPLTKLIKVISLPQE